jgi:rhomboid-like protein
MCYIGTAAYHYLETKQDESPELESTASHHFLAFFISGKAPLVYIPSFFDVFFFFCAAGLFSGLVSHIASAKFRYPKIVAQLISPASTVQKTETWAGAVAATSSSSVVKSAATEVPRILPSLGASGAIYAAATMTALAFPEAHVALFIPPTYPINIQYGIGGLMMIDVIGIMRGWRSV